MPMGRASRGSPREAGGTCRRGAIVNSAHAVGISDYLVPFSVTLRASLWRGSK